MPGEHYGSSFKEGEEGRRGDGMVDDGTRRHKRLLTADVTNIFHHFGMFGGASSPSPQRSIRERSDQTNTYDDKNNNSHNGPPNESNVIFRISSDSKPSTIEEEIDPDIERARLMDRLKHGSFDETDGNDGDIRDRNKQTYCGSYDDGEEGERFVHYDSTSHFGVIFQLHGSVWPKVLPYCVLNTIFFWIVTFVDSLTDLDISVSSTGHSLTALLLAFLVIQRSGIVYSRYMNARHCLEDMNRICCEIVQISCIYSKHDCSEEAKSWRSRLAFTTIVLLRTTVAALEFNNTKINAWDILPGDSSATTSNDRLTSFVRDSLNAMDQDRTGHLVLQERWAHGKRSVLNRNYKAPSVLAYRLRDTVLENRRKIVKPQKMQLLEEVQIMNLINSYVVDYQKLKADISTPFPFPFVQMARTFLFVWIFSMPFAMARDVKNIPLASFLVFFATYGFIGVELVSMELDDPYGDDDNDIDDVALAQMTFEDIYISILKTDGIQRATKLRETVKDLAKRSIVVSQHQEQPSTGREPAQSQEATKMNEQQVTISNEQTDDKTGGTVLPIVTENTRDVLIINETTPLQSFRRRGSSIGSVSGASTRNNSILDIY